MTDRIERSGAEQTYREEIDRLTKIIILGVDVLSQVPPTVISQLRGTPKSDRGRSPHYWRTGKELPIDYLMPYKGNQERTGIHNILANEGQSSWSVSLSRSSQKRRLIGHAPSRFSPNAENAQYRAQFRHRESIFGEQVISATFDITMTPSTNPDRLPHGIRRFDLTESIGPQLLPASEALASPEGVVLAAIANAVSRDLQAYIQTN